MSATKLMLFVSYAHEDESFRRDFEKHLAALKLEGLLEEWSDRMILAGKDWEKEIHTNLDQSHIIVLFISPDFMASRYCNQIEVTRAMDRHKMGTARVIPVLIRPSDWNGAPFSKLQAIPTNALPVSEWKGRDAAFADVVQHLRSVCHELAAIPGNPANPYVTATIGDWYEAQATIDVLPTSMTKLASMRMTLIDKKHGQATVQMEVTSTDLGNFTNTISIPLDRPLEDSYGQLTAAVSEPIPANATIESRLVGAGTEKLFIGGNTYYTTWTEKEMEVRLGCERSVQKIRNWISSDIPLDGIVKMVMEIPNVMKQTMIVTGYGRAGKGGSKGKTSDKPATKSYKQITCGKYVIRTNVISDMIRKAVFDEEQTGRLGKIIEQFQRQQGVNPTKENIQLLVRMVREYIEHVPLLLEQGTTAAVVMGLQAEMGQILQQVESYWFDTNDLIPDNLGLLGLMDDAYATLFLLQSLSDYLHANYGRPLLQQNWTPANLVMRNLIGEPIVSILDQRIGMVISSAMMQSMLAHVANSGYAFPTVPDPIWGNASIEDIVAHRMGMLGF